MRSRRGFFRTLVSPTVVCLLLTACAMQPIADPGGRTGRKRPCGGEELDCRGYFSQAHRDFKANFSTFLSTGAGIGAGASQLIALDSISGDMIGQYQRYCQLYNACLMSEEEFIRRTDALHAIQMEVRKAVPASPSSRSDPGSYPIATPSDPGSPTDPNAPVPPVGLFPDGTTKGTRTAEGIFKLLVGKLASLSRIGTSSGVITSVSPPQPSPSPQPPGPQMRQAGSTGDDPLRAIVAELREIARPKPGTQELIKAVLGQISYRDTDYASPLSVFLKDRLQEELSRSGAFALVEPRSLRGLEVVARPRSVTALADASGADIVISGNYWDNPDQVEVFLSVRQREGDALLGVAQALLPSSNLPPDTPVVPANLVRARESERLQDRIAPHSALQTESPLKVEVWTDRGKGAVYTEGEEVGVMVRVSQDAYLYLYYTDANNDTYQIFPNQFHREAWIRGGGIVTIPDSQHGFLFRVKPPFGVESITAVASSERIPGLEVANGSPGLHKRLPEGLRGIEVVAKPFTKKGIVRDSTVLTTMQKGQ